LTAPVLHEALLTFPLDTTPGKPSFEDRLRLSCGWTPEYTRRVILEYRRFLYLVAVTQEPLVPSADIDQVWQMHLSYTQSYWEELCMKILQRPLHHHPPAVRGRERRARYHVWYERSRRRYQQEFGVAPPEPVWTPPESLFDTKRIVCERVNLSRYWIIPKPRWNWQTLALLVPAVMVPLTIGASDWAAGMVAGALAVLALLGAALWADYQQRRGMSA